MTILEILGIASLLFVAGFTWWGYAHNTQTLGQSRLASVVEAWANIVLGFSINYSANLLLLPLVGAHLTVSSNFWLGCVYTAISMLRQVAVRRWFNERIHLFAARAAERLS